MKGETTRLILKTIEEARKTGKKILTNDENITSYLKNISIESEVVKLPKRHISKELELLISYDEFNEFIKTSTPDK